MKSAWIRVIEEHTVSDEEGCAVGTESQSGTQGNRSSWRVVRGWKGTSGNHPHGFVYLEIYPIAPILGDHGPHFSESHCFVAHAVDPTDDDFIVLCSKWNDYKFTCYLPWANIGAIRHVAFPKKDA